MVGVAVVGAGNWGKNLVRNFASLPGARLEDIVDVSEKVRQSLAGQYSQAKVVADLAAARNRVLMVGHLLEYHPAVQYPQGDAGRLEQDGRLR